MKPANSVRRKVVDAARERLRAAIDRACVARGEAQWTNGYRAGAFRAKRNEVEDRRLYDKEMAQFRHCGVAERTAERAMRAYAQAIRRGK